ncbi:hypothetical protein [Rhodohalobacter mucosus]|uniref:hypothetical protein n=1 Tax=Rhodohalobacter mucosus TaxID=2079485 RepID=UPI0011B28C6D|nr:hypothetical protein [Rhodohalobacter mucosus]
MEKFLDKYNITDPDERAEYYESGVPAGQGTSSGDLLYAVEHGITSYYMDGETVMKYYDGSTKELVHEPEDRCGF